MTKEEWVALFQAMNGRDPLPQEFLAAKNAGEFTTEPAPLPAEETSTVEPTSESDVVPEAITEAPAQKEALSQVEVPHDSVQEETVVDFEPPLASAPEFQSNSQQENQHFYQQESSNSYSNMNYQSGYGQGTPVSYFDGGVLEYWLYQIGGNILISITILIATPWVLCMIERWRVRHIVIDGRRLRFDGTGSQLFGNWIKWLLLMIITFGIYGFWVAVKLEQWKAKHTHFE